MAASKQLLRVDVVSDIMCPWCWVGKRKLEEAMELCKGSPIEWYCSGPDTLVPHSPTTEKYDFRVRWQPFLLRPEMPKEGVQKAPNTPQNPRVGHRMKQAGQKVGIDFTGKFDIYPRTVLAHTLMEYAYEEEDGVRQDQLQEIIFRGYFTDGDAPDMDNCLKFAKEAGLNIEAAKKFISDEKNQKVAFNRAIYWSAQGVTGVPTFYMNGRQTFSGAQEKEAFLKMFDWAATKHPNGTLAIPPSHI